MVNETSVAISTSNSNSNSLKPIVNDSVFNERRYIAMGLLFLILFAGGFGGWITFSELDAAAIAPGTVTVEGQRKSIEHFEGGIVSEILVKDGDVVEKDQPLIKLSSVSARTRFIQLSLKYYSLLAQEQRLHAERSHATRLVFSDDLLNKEALFPSLNSALNTQTLLFNARLNVKKNELANIDVQLQSIRNDKAMYAAKLQQEELAYSYLIKELDIHEKLLAKGFSSKLQSIELKRTKANYSSSLIELKGRLLKQNMAELEAEQRKIATEYTYISEIEQELQEVSKLKDDTLELLVQAKDILSRVVIKSPSEGQVVGLSIFNKGDVISPGETLLEIVPFNERLIIVAKLKPEDIDVIKVGQSAMVFLSAYSFRTTPPVSGTVIHVAADRLEERNGQESDGFTIKVSIEQSVLAGLSDVELHPGMPAEVYIKLKSRTPLDYLLAPLSLDFFRAFRES